MADADRAASKRLRLGTGSLLVALGVAIASAAATQVPAGAGAPSPDKTIPTLPPASGDVPSTAPDSSVVDTAVTGSSEVVAPVSTVPGVETGIPLRAGAGPSELFAAANRAFQSEDDVAAGLGGFAVIPTGIPTPAGTAVGSISVSYSAELESYVASAEITTTADADDVVAFYRTVLAAEGFALARDHTEASVHELEFARRESDDDAAGVLVSIDSSDGVVVDIEITDHADAATLEAFAGWPAGLPGLEEGRPISARITATRDGSTTMTMSTTFAYDGTTADELTRRIRDGLASSAGGFSVSDDDEGGSTIALDHAIIDDAVAAISDADGVTQLQVDGSLG